MPTPRAIEPVSCCGQRVGDPTQIRHQPLVFLAEDRGGAYTTHWHRSCSKTGVRSTAKPALLRKARIVSGDYGTWRVPAEHHGREIWIVAEPPRPRRFRDCYGRVAEAMVYRRPEGLVARAEYLELVEEYRLMSGAPLDRRRPTPFETLH
jgi:hypothetical protein